MAKVKRVLVLGASGMLGHIVYDVFKSDKDLDVYAVSRKEKISDDTILLDVTDKDKLWNTLAEIRPHFVVNCVGVLIKGSNSNPENAIYINALLPHQLASMGREMGFRLIHISTDCVFNGEKGNYIETDNPDAKDIYGKSKALGEIINEIDLTIRTSIIGPELKQNGEGLLHWFLTQKGTVKGYKNAFWSGVTTLELAQIIYELYDKTVTGIKQIAPDTKISKYDLLYKLNGIFKKQLDILPDEKIKVDKSLLKSSVNVLVKDYDDQITELRNYMQGKYHGEKKYTIYSACLF